MVTYGNHWCLHWSYVFPLDADFGCSGWSQMDQNTRITSGWSIIHDMLLNNMLNKFISQESLLKSWGWTAGISVLFVLISSILVVVSKTIKDFSFKKKICFFMSNWWFLNILLLLLLIQFFSFFFLFLLLFI